MQKTSSNPLAETDNSMESDGKPNRKITRRTFAKTAVASSLVLPVLGTRVNAEPTVAGGATQYDGVTLSQSGYDYAPSVMYGDGSRIKAWWCGSNNGDAIFYSELSSSGWTSPERVLSPSDSGWDSVHVCDPTVVTGGFSADGQTWDYAMYFSGADNGVGTNTQIGVAFSNGGTSWQKYSGNPIVSPLDSPTDSYGAGMPTAYREPGTDSTVSLAFFDATDNAANHVVAATDGITFGSRTELTANPIDGTAIGDVAFFPDEDVWYVSTKNNNDQECYLYKTATSDLNSTWTECGRINSALTGNHDNHNPGWMRWPNGDLREEPATLTKYVYFGTGGDSPSTWDIGQATYKDGWEFDVDGNREGWESRNVSMDGGEPTDGTWKAVADQADPQWVSPDLAINADATTTVVVRMANQNEDTTGKIYFRTASEDYLSEDKSVTFEVDNNGAWTTYEVDVSTNANWTGTVTALRLDPIETGSGDPIGIDYVRLDH